MCSWISRGCCASTERRKSLPISDRYGWERGRTRCWSGSSCDWSGIPIPGQNCDDERPSANEHHDHALERAAFHDGRCEIPEPEQRADEDDRTPVDNGARGTHAEI